MKSVVCLVSRLLRSSEIVTPPIILTQSAHTVLTDLLRKDLPKFIAWIVPSWWTERPYDGRVPSTTNLKHPRGKPKNDFAPEGPKKGCNPGQPFGVPQELSSFREKWMLTLVVLWRRRTFLPFALFFFPPSNHGRWFFLDIQCSEHQSLWGSSLRPFRWNRLRCRSIFHKHCQAAILSVII